MAFNYAKFEAFILSLSLKHFDAREILVRTEVDPNYPPDESLWPNIVLTMSILDIIRDHFGAPVVLTSAYRSYEYNQTLSGAAQRS